MATAQDSSLPQFEPPFRLFAADSRVLAQNAAGKIIDIGDLACLPDGACQIKLDVDAVDSGPQRDARAALDALVPALTYDYLDALFTSESGYRNRKANRRIDQSCRGRFFAQTFHHKNKYGSVESHCLFTSHDAIFFVNSRSPQPNDRRQIEVSAETYRYHLVYNK